MHLQIKQIADLPVGENLQDHVMTEANTYMIDKPWSINEGKMGTLWDKLRYQFSGEGDLFYIQLQFSRNHEKLTKCLSLNYKESIQYKFLFVSGYMSTSGVQGAAFMRSKYQPKDVKYPFIQFHLYSYSFGSGPNIAKHWKTFVRYDEKVFYYILNCRFRTRLYT